MAVRGSACIPGHTRLTRDRVFIERTPSRMLSTNWSPFPPPPHATMHTQRRHRAALTRGVQKGARSLDEDDQPAKAADAVADAAANAAAAGAVPSSTAASGTDR